MTNKDYKPLTTGGYSNPKMSQEYRDRLCYLEDCIENGTLVFLPGSKAQAETVKEFAEKLKQAICDNTYPYFDKNGKPVNIWNTDGFDRIDELLKEFIEQ